MLGLYALLCLNPFSMRCWRVGVQGGVVAGFTGE